MHWFCGKFYFYIVFQNTLNSLFKFTFDFPTKEKVKSVRQDVFLTTLWQNTLDLLGKVS